MANTVSEAIILQNHTVLCIPRREKWKKHHVLLFFLVTHKKDDSFGYMATECQGRLYKR